MRDTQRERGRDIGRGRSRLPVGSPMWDWIQGLQDHTLGWRQAPNHWATQGFPWPNFLIWRLRSVFSPENLFFFLRFYLFIHERHTERERQRHRQREKQALCRGLNPRTLGSRPEPRADAQPLRDPGVLLLRHNLTASPIIEDFPLCCL